MQFLCDTDTDLTYVNCTCKQIEFIDPTTFHGLLNLTELDLSFNLLRSILKNAFNSLSILKKLSLSNNQITSVDSHTFKSLVNLRALDLSRNHINSLDGSVLSPLKHLQTLNLDSNRLNMVDVDAFHSLANLQILTLSFNKLHSIDNLFQGLSNLQEIYMQSNVIAKVDPKTAFIGLNNVYKLDLSNNQLSSLASDTFNPLRIPLGSLILNNNKLTVIDALDLYCCNLESIDLCNNSIKNVDSTNCANFTSLKLMWEDTVKIKPNDCYK